MTLPPQLVLALGEGGRRSLIGAGRRGRESTGVVRDRDCVDVSQRRK
jgi:hypothetical protein